MTRSAHPRGFGTPALNRKLTAPWGQVSGSPREGRIDPSGKVHRVEVSWTLRNGITLWRATCGYRTGPVPTPESLLPAGHYLDVCQANWRASLLDPTDCPAVLCNSCYSS